MKRARCTKDKTTHPSPSIEKRELKFPTLMKSYNDQGDGKPNRIVVYFLIPPCEGGPMVMIRGDGKLLSVSYRFPIINDNHVQELFKERGEKDAEGLFLATREIFLKFAMEQPLLKQSILLPFKVEQEFAGELMEIKGFDYLRVVLKRFEVKGFVEFPLEKKVRIPSTTSESISQSQDDFSYEYNLIC